MEFIGKTFGKFRIDRLLGEGGMGAVYQAYDLSLQRDVAIKLIHPHFGRQPDFRERLLQEARAAIQRNHPGLVKTFEFGQLSGQLYVAMEYLPGGNLRQLLDKLIQERKWLPLREAVLLAQQLCRTLEYAHQHKVLHRDIKPANLMLKAEPAEGLPFRVVLTDLGLARLLEGQGLTQEGTSMGTPAYMSPEQALGQETDPRSDVYSLGILLYELVVGLFPFPIKTITEAIHYHTKEQPPAPRSIRPDLPEALERVILKALEKEPDKRYSSAAELETALAETISNSPEAFELGRETDSALFDTYRESLVTPPQMESTSLEREPERSDVALQPAFIPTPDEIPQKFQFSIQVLSRGKKPQDFTFQTEKITIGRDRDNQIALDDPEVSRKHVQVTWNGSDFYVTDLKSRNGTFLANTRLQPDTPKIWNPHQVLRVSGFFLRLIGQRLPGAVMKRSTAGMVGVSVTPQQLSVEAGGSVTASISLLNQSPLADHVYLSLTGIPSNWIVSLPSRVELMPGEQKETILSLQVPRTPQSRAGPHQMTLRATSQRDPSQFAESRLTLTVAPFAQFKAELQPQRLRAGQTGRLSLSNLGNLQETFTVQFTDPAEELAFQPPQLQLRVPEGGTAMAEFQAQLRQTRWLGGEKSHPFSAQVSQPKGEAQSLPAELLSRALLPLWAPVLFVLLCLAFLGAATWISAQGQSSRLATQTAVALTSDLDKDGLTFGAEIAYGCDPNNPDSDGDGLLDSEEKTWATNCTVRDSDHDNLSDGDEVHTLKTNPMNPDTDGDGLLDNVDPNPGSLPTQTPRPGTTAPAPSPSSTPSQTANAPLTTNITNKILDRNTATFTFSGTGAAAFECKLGSTDFTTCTSPKSYSNLADGSYTFEVRARDVTGKIFSTPDRFTWIIDTTAPDTKIIGSPPNPSSNASVTFTFSATDSGTGVASFECRLDNGNFTGCNSPWSTILADGPHTFEVRAKDVAGNTDASSSSFTWTVEAAPPSVTAISLPASHPSNAASVTYTVTFSESVTNVDVADFELTKSVETIDAKVLDVKGSGKSYSVTVNIDSGNGTIRLDLIDNDTILDGGNHKLGGEGPGNGDFNGQVHTVNKPPSYPNPGG